MNKIGYYLLSGLFLISCPACGDRNHVAGEGDLPAHTKKLDSLRVYPIDSKPQMSIRLEREAQYGNDEDIMTGLPRHVSIDDRGRVYLGDSGWGYRGIHVFEPDGSFIKTMGGEGKGPGELMEINNMGVVNDELYLFDGNLERINFYSLETLSHDRTQILDTGNWSHIDSLRGSYPTGYHFRDDGTCLVSFTDPLELGRSDIERYTHYYLADKKGKIIAGKVLKLPTLKFLHSTVGGRNSAFTLDHNRESLLAHTSSGEIVTAWTEDFLLRKYGPNGSYQGSIYYPFERQQIDRNKILTKHDDAWKDLPQQINRYKKRIRNADLPDYWPALKQILVDDEGRFWVATIGKDEANFDWWVLEESGQLIGKFKFPRDNTVIKVKDGSLYARVAEEGTDPLARYRVEMQPLTNKVPNESQ